MVSAPRVLVRPPLRCFHVSKGPAPTPCGQPAIAIRPGGVWGVAGFVCAQHAGALDLPLPVEVTFRRVRVLAQVDFTGVSWLAGSAEAEAIARLERAVADAGGLVSNAAASSSMVSHRADEGALGASGVGR